MKVEMAVLWTDGTWSTIIINVPTAHSMLSDEEIERRARAVCDELRIKGREVAMFALYSTQPELPEG